MVLRARLLLGLFEAEQRAEVGGKLLQRPTAQVR